MRKRRLFVPQLPAAGGPVALPSDSVRHARVLRLAQGASVRLFDAQGLEADARLTALTRASVQVAALPPERVAAALPRAHLLLALPKAAKLEGIVRMCGELGVHSIHLAQCERSVPVGLSAQKLSRLVRVAREACAQSGQGQMLTLRAVAPLSETLARRSIGSTAAFCWVGAAVAIDACFTQATSDDVWVAVGPEGGFTQAEADALSAAGFAPVGLGPAVLRVETAVPVALGLMLTAVGRLQQPTQVND